MSSFRNEARAARPRWAARSCVLSRAHSAAMDAPCVLVSHSPIAPGQRVVIPKGALGGYLRGPVVGPLVGMGHAAREHRADEEVDDDRRSPQHDRESEVLAAGD